MPQEIAESLEYQAAHTISMPDKDRAALEQAATYMRKIANGELRQAVHAHWIDYMADKKSKISGCPPCDKDGCKNTCKGHFGKMEGIPSELADVIIRVLDMCEHYGIDIEAALKEKHEFNKTRPYKHGGKVM